MHDSLERASNIMFKQRDMILPKQYHKKVPSLSAPKKKPVSKQCLFCNVLKVCKNKIGISGIHGLDLEAVGTRAGSDTIQTRTMRRTRWYQNQV